MLVASIRLTTAVVVSFLAVCISVADFLAQLVLELLEIEQADWQFCLTVDQLTLAQSAL